MDYFTVTAMSMTLLDTTRNTIGTTLLFILGIVVMVMMRTINVTCMISHVIWVIITTVTGIMYVAATSAATTMVIVVTLHTGLPTSSDSLGDRLRRRRYRCHTTATCVVSVVVVVVERVTSTTTTTTTTGRIAIVPWLACAVMRCYVVVVVHVLISSP